MQLPLPMFLVRLLRSAHILTNSSCIVLIFKNQHNLVIESGVHPSLHPNCFHEIAFAKLNLKIDYPSLYECLIWDYKKANEQLINRAIDIFYWEKSFEGNVHDQVNLFDKILNIL